MSNKIGRKIAKTKKKAKKIGEKAGLGLGQVVANEGRVSIAVGKVLKENEETENIGETLISTGRVERSTGRGIKKLSRGDMEGANKQGERALEQAKKIDLEKAVLAGKEAEILFA